MALAVVLDYITHAAVTVGELGAGETLSTELQNYCLDAWNAMVDSMQTNRSNLPNVTLASFTLTANVGAYNIGPTGGFATTLRPIIIESAAPIASDGTTRMRSLNQLTSKQWEQVPGRGAKDTYPTDMFQQPNIASGNIDFSVLPIPTSGISLELAVWVPLLSSSSTLSTAVTLPYGYMNWLKYILIVTLAPVFNRPIDPNILGAAQQAIQNLQELNAQIMAGNFGSARTLQGANIGMPFPLGAQAAAAQPAAEQGR